MRHAIFGLLGLLAVLPACDDDGGGPAAQSGRLDAAIGADADAPDVTPPDAADGVDAGLADAAPDAEVTVDEGVPPPPAEPGDPGPYRVGFHTETITYANPALAADRPLDLHWWYPTVAERGEAVRYAGIFPRFDVLGDAPPLDGPLPLVVFSHGNGGLAEQSYFLTEFLATHGFVVVAPDHTGNTFEDDSQPTWRLFELRPQDIKAVLDHADALPAGHPLAGHLGPQRGMTGHSFGGYTSLAVAGAGFDVAAIQAGCAAPPESETDACHYLADAGTQARYAAAFGDARFQAAIPLTPAGAGLFGGDPGLAGIAIPTLMMTAGRDATLPNPLQGDPLWAGITQADSLRLDFLEAGHFTFSDACTIAPAAVMNDGCGPDFLDNTTAHRLINAYALAFLRLHLLGDAQDLDLLDGSLRIDDGALTLSTVE
ncbi:MAG: alpha/beta hydrolase [Myxococcales bacterium]|nr:alpha/beta hydrolase [Myxococcales bacterium]